MLKHFARVGQGLLDLALPSACPCCDISVTAHGLVCASCYAGLPLVAEPLCVRCGVPVPLIGMLDGQGQCRACREHPPGYDQARAALIYAAQVKSLMLAFKHGDRLDLIDLFVSRMAQAGRTLLARADLLVPVPLHWGRFVRRGHNQAGALAQELALRAGKPCGHAVLERPRPTERLAGFGAAERADRMAEALRVRPRQDARLEGRQVLLVDDVLTSGATASAAARALRAAGATRVDVLAAARALDPLASIKITEA